jgi:polar amino acid transport system permease protein
MTDEPISIEAAEYRLRVVQILVDTVRAIGAATGLNLAHLTEAFDRTRLLGGMLTTVKLASLCILVSLLIGVAGAWLQISRFRSVRGAATAYVQLFRNTPPLVQLYFFYFALGPLIRAPDESGIARPLLGSFTWAALSLSLFAGAFNVEIFRAGIEAVPRTTLLAAESLGFTKGGIFRAVTLPLAIRIALPALANNLVNLVKTTTLAYAIAVPETLFVANQIWSDRLNVTEVMITLFVFYMVLVGIVALLFALLEDALRIPGFGRGPGDKR